MSVVTNEDTILSMLKVQKARGANLTVLNTKAITAKGKVLVPEGSQRVTSGDAVEDPSHAGARSQADRGTPVGEAEMNPADNISHLRTQMKDGVPEKLPLMQEPDDEVTPLGIDVLNNMRKPPPPPPLSYKLMPKFISRKFDEPPADGITSGVTSDLVPKCASVDECAKKIAHFLVSMERVGTKHTRSIDETSACNAEPRVDELVQQMAVFLGGKSFSTFGPMLVNEAFKAEAIKCGHTMSNMLDMRLDKLHPGRCSECRETFERLDLHPCLLCGQMLCDLCLPDGCHNWCVTPSAWSKPLRTFNAPATHRHGLLQSRPRRMS